MIKVKAKKFSPKTIYKAKNNSWIINIWKPSKIKNWKSNFLDIFIFYINWVNKYIN